MRSRYSLPALFLEKGVFYWTDELEESLRQVTRGCVRLITMQSRSVGQRVGLLGCKSQELPALRSGYANLQKSSSGFLVI